MLNILAAILLTFLKFNYFSVNKVIFGETYFINQGDSYFIEWMSVPGFPCNCDYFLYVISFKILNIRLFHILYHMKGMKSINVTDKEIEEFFTKYKNRF